MVTNHIELSGGESRSASKLRSLIDNTSRLQDDFRRIKAVMDEAGASTSDRTALEGLFGIPAGKGAAAYTLIVAAAARINAAGVDDLCNRMG